MFKNIMSLAYVALSGVLLTLFTIFATRVARRKFFRTSLPDDLPQSGPQQSLELLADEIHAFQCHLSKVRCSANSSTPPVEIPNRQIQDIFAAHRRLCNALANIDDYVQSHLRVGERELPQPVSGPSGDSPSPPSEENNNTN